MKVAIPAENSTLANLFSFPVGRKEKAISTQQSFYSFLAIHLTCMKYRDHHLKGFMKNYFNVANELFQLPTLSECFSFVHIWKKIPYKRFMSSVLWKMQSIYQITYFCQLARDRRKEDSDPQTNYILCGFNFRTCFKCYLYSFEGLLERPGKSTSCLSIRYSSPVPH